MTEYEKWDLLVTSISAAVTFLAVMVALFGEKMRLWWDRPELRILFNDKSGSLTTRQDQQRGRYYSLTVTNQRRSSPAKNVRVHLIGIDKIGPDGAWRPIRFSAPVHVTWKFPATTPPYLTVGPNEDSTFVYVLEGSERFELQLYWYPNNLDPTFPPNEPVRLSFKAVSDNAESNTLIVEVAWDGQWREGSEEMMHHFVVNHVSETD